MGILDVNKEEFERCVREYWKEYKHPEFIYFKCIKDIETKELDKFGEEDIKGPIRTFLINWGLMGKILFRKDYKNWEQKLLKLIKDDIFRNTLDELRVKRLEDCKSEDLSKLERGI